MIYIISLLKLHNLDFQWQLLNSELPAVHISGPFLQLMAPYDCWVSPVRVMKIMKFLLKDTRTSMNPYCSWCSCAAFDAKNQEVDPLVGEGLNDHEQTTSGGAGSRHLHFGDECFCTFWDAVVLDLWQSQKDTGTSGQHQYYGFTIVLEETFFPNLPFESFWCISGNYFPTPHPLGSLWCPSILSQFLTVSMKRQDWLTTKSARNLRSEAWQTYSNSRHDGIVNTVSDQSTIWAYKFVLNVYVVTGYVSYDTF